MNILPAINTVVCKNPPESKTKSGLHLPGADGKKPEIGVVIAVGEPKKGGEMPVKFKVGDTIVFRRYADNRIFIEGEELNFIDFKDVVGVLKSEDD